MSSNHTESDTPPTQGDELIASTMGRQDQSQGQGQGPDVYHAAATILGKIHETKASIK